MKHNCRVRPKLDNIARLYKHYNNNILSHPDYKYEWLYQPDDLWDEWNEDKEETVEEYVEQVNTTMAHYRELERNEQNRNNREATK